MSPRTSVRGIDQFRRSREALGRATAPRAPSVQDARARALVATPVGTGRLLGVRGAQAKVTLGGKVLTMPLAHVEVIGPGRPLPPDALLLGDGPWRFLLALVLMGPAHVGGVRARAGLGLRSSRRAVARLVDVGLAEWTEDRDVIRPLVELHSLPG